LRFLPSRRRRIVLKSLLVGLNGGPATPAVIDFALQTALVAGAIVAAAPVVDVDAITHGEPVPLGGAAFKYHRDRERVATATAAAAASVSQLSIAAQTRGASYALLEKIEDVPDFLVAAQRFDAIVVSQWAGNDRHEQPDPMLQHLVQQSPRPVIAVPAEFAPGEAIVVAYDGSLQSARALQLFACLQPIVLPVLVVCVDRDAATAQRHVETAREFLRLHQIDCGTHALTGDPGRVLREFVAAQRAALLVMGAYGKPTWREFFLGTVTRKILSESHVPLWLCH
jgi:nucleotide-binding universal stress UspA family protein